MKWAFQSVMISSWNFYSYFRNIIFLLFWSFVLEEKSFIIWIKFLDSLRK